MQNITMQVLNGRWEVTGQTTINFAEIIGGILWNTDNFEKNYPWLNTVDPYGDTLFNQKQGLCVAQELRNLLNEVNNEKDRDLIISAIPYFEEMRDLQYIKLIGD